MRTNVVLDDTLVREAILLSGVKTKKDVIALVLQEFVSSRKRLNLMELEGKINFREDYDYKNCRELGMNQKLERSGRYFLLK